MELTSDDLSTSGQRGRRRAWGMGIGAVFLAMSPGLALAGGALTVPNPPGSFLVRANLSIPANPFPNSVFANADMADDDYLGGDDLCAMSGDTDQFHPFVTDTIRITAAGTFTFRVVNSQGVADPFLAVYSGTFDKSNPDDGVLGCNDDISDNEEPYASIGDGDIFDSNGHDNYEYPEMDGLFSLFEVDLEPGVYTIMLATYDDYLDNAEWYEENGDTDLSIVGGLGTATFSGTATATFEYWGPEGSIEGGVGSAPSFGNEDYLDHLNERVAAETASDLPDTGTSLPAINMVVALGCLAVGSTFIVLSRRRRLV